MRQTYSVYCKTPMKITIKGDENDAMEISSDSLDTYNCIEVSLKSHEEMTPIILLLDELQAAVSAFLELRALNNEES